MQAHTGRMVAGASRQTSWSHPWPMAYRNVHVHGDITGVAANARKEEIQQFIEDQLEIGDEGLDEKDHYLLEVNLEDL